MRHPHTPRRGQPAALSSFMLLVTLLALAGCGGGGGEASPGNDTAVTVTATAGPGGAIAPDSVTVTHGETASFTVTPDAGFVIDTVSGCNGTLAGTTFTTGPVTADCAVSAAFTAAAPPAPSLAIAYTSVKTFRFTWTDVPRETEYRLLENPDGTSGYTQVATIAADATSHELTVFLPERINARYLLQACSDDDCADSNEVTVDAAGLTQAIGYVKASNTDQGDLFGHAVALSGDGTTLAVGAVFEDSSATGMNGNQNNNTASAAGAVYVFVRGSDGAWSQQAYVKASNTDSDDRFGHALALSRDGNTLAVSAIYEASAATGVGDDQTDNSLAKSGAVYVFTRNASGAWSQQAYVKASNTDQGDHFGYAVALSGDGDTLAVSAIFEDSSTTGLNGDQSDNSLTNSGAVYVFTRDADGAWSQQAYVKASNAGSLDRFGQAVALSGDGDTLAVGAHNEDSGATGVNGDQNDNTASASGAVYVFVRDADGAWSQPAYVKASNTGKSDQFGYAVALSGDGDTLAVGARNEGSSATGVNGDQNDNTASASGAVYVFVRDADGAWSQQAYVKASSTDSGDQFGQALALSGDGDTLAVGALFEDGAATGVGGDPTDNLAGDSGAVYLFARDGNGTWRQLAYVKASNTDSNDRFGHAVALSGDGDILAVGARFEDGNATGVGGDPTDNSATSAGAAYLY